jgi:hypothetical protein
MIKILTGRGGIPSGLAWIQSPNILHLSYLAEPLIQSDLQLVSADTFILEPCGNRTQNPRCCKHYALLTELYILCILDAKQVTSIAQYITKQ